MLVARVAPPGTPAKVVLRAAGASANAIHEDEEVAHVEKTHLVVSSSARVLVLVPSVAGRSQIKDRAR